jgi:hypothetical protein
MKIRRLRIENVTSVVGESRDVLLGQFRAGNILFPEALVPAPLPMSAAASEASPEAQPGAAA